MRAIESSRPFATTFTASLAQPMLASIGFLDDHDGDEQNSPSLTTTMTTTATATTAKATSDRRWLANMADCLTANLWLISESVCNSGFTLTCWPAQFLKPERALGSLTVGATLAIIKSEPSLSSCLNSEPEAQPVQLEGDSDAGLFGSKRSPVSRLVVVVVAAVAVCSFPSTGRERLIRLNRMG